MSKITPPDTNFLDFNDTGLRRGIRTLGEIAHYVRCIPFKVNENLKIWASPDFLLTIRVGAVDEHTLLMASMFMATKYESTEELENS